MDEQIKPEQKNTDSAPVVVPLSSPVQTIDGNLKMKQEGTRSQIANTVVKGFIGIIILGLVFGAVLLYASKITFNDLTSLLVTISGILSGTLGFVIGFYFKSH